MLAVISYPPITPIHLGPFHLSIHSVFIAAGFIAGAWLATRHLRRSAGNTAEYQSVLSWALIDALIGALHLTVYRLKAPPDEHARDKVVLSWHPARIAASRAR